MTKFEQIAGIWNPIKMVDFGSDGIPRNIKAYVGCEESSRWIFFENGEFDKEEFTAGFSEGMDCEEDLESENLESGTWEKLDDSHISIVITYKNGETETKSPEFGFVEFGFLEETTMRLFFEGASPDIEYSCLEFRRSK